jgi:hypothetical protein
MTRYRKPARAGGRKRSTHSAARIKVNSSKASSSRTQALTAARPSKKGAILALLQRPQGAMIGELTAATGWQSHSVRAVLTGLRKEGRELLRDKDDAAVTRYRISPGG